MIFFLALLAVAACSSHATGCDMPFLCFKIEESIKVSENTYRLLQNVDSKSDTLDEKVDRILLNERLQTTLLMIDRSKFDVSRVYKGRFYIATKSEARFNIQTANRECQAQGGYLLELDDNAERTYVYDFVKRIGGASHFATGGNDISSEGTWVYVNSGKPVPKDLQWLSGEPNNHGGSEDCMVYRMSHGGLNDIPCNNIVKYVCEIPFANI